MGLIRKITNIEKLIVDSNYRFMFFDSLGFYNYVNDYEYIKRKYEIIMGSKLNIETPISFNEKLQWLKINDRQERYVRMVDKAEAKKYVAEITPSLNIIPTIGVWDCFDEIEFDNLPERFVLKCTHDSGSYFICKDKYTIDFKKAKKKICKALKTNFYYYGREWPYKNVKPRIIAEQYVDDIDNGDLYDYKFFCFNGYVQCYKIDFNRQISHRANYYDRQSNLLRFGEVVCPPDFNKTFNHGSEIQSMISMAESLSQGIPFLRVDFYYCSGIIYFGELTFFPASGWGRFEPESANKLLGDWLVLREFVGESK